MGVGGLKLGSECARALSSTVLAVIVVDRSAVSIMTALGGNELVPKLSCLPKVISIVSRHPTAVTSGSELLKGTRPAGVTRSALTTQSPLHSSASTTPR